MAATPNPTVAQIQSDAQQLFAEINAKGVNVADPKEIVASAQRLLGLLDSLQPHINKAQQGFGGNDAVVQQANDLRNKLNKIIVTYKAG